MQCTQSKIEVVSHNRRSARCSFYLKVVSISMFKYSIYFRGEFQEFIYLIKAHYKVKSVSGQWPIQPELILVSEA